MNYNIRDVRNEYIRWERRRMQMKELERSNRVAMIAHGVINACMLFISVIGSGIGSADTSWNHTGFGRIYLLEEGSCDQSYKTSVTDRICVVLYGAAFYGTVQHGVCICNSHDVCSHALS